MGKEKTNTIFAKFTLLLATVVVLGTATLVSAQNDRLIGGAGITLFVDRNFRGNVQTFQYDVADLRSSGLDNRVSSIRVGPGEQWEVCENRNYGGRCIVVSGEEYDLARNGWNDRISSIRRATGGGGGWNPGNPGWGRPPSWAVGTFYGRAPQTGAAITLTIGSDGNVTANIGASASYGHLRGETLTIGSSQGRVYRTNNGIRTVSSSDGETIEYSRNYNGGGWNPGNPGWGGGSAPRWAVGTFYGRNPNTGGGITMTIESNGRVSIIFDGSQNITYASINNDLLQVGDSTARVTRIRNGIRTRSTTDGLTIDYFRR